VQVKSIKFKNQVCDIVANRRSVVVTFNERIAIFDACTLEDRLSVTTCYPSPGPNPNPVALGSRWLAYAEKKLMWQRSSGGAAGNTKTGNADSEGNTAQEENATFYESLPRLCVKYVC